jgi:hypothetical protein
MKRTTTKAIYKDRERYPLAFFIFYGKEIEKVCYDRDRKKE